MEQRGKQLLSATALSTQLKFNKDEAKNTTELEESTSVAEHYSVPNDRREYIYRALIHSKHICFVT